MMKGDFNQATYADLRLVLRSSQGGTSTSSDDPASTATHMTGSSLDDDAHSFYTHRVILASKSPVINALLLRAKEQRELQAMGGGLRIHLVAVECIGAVGLLVLPPTCQLTYLQLEILELPLEQEELLAGEVLFRSIYSDDLAEDVRSVLSSEQGAGVSRVKLLLQVYRLADRLEVCIDQCAQAMSDLSSADCDSVDVVNYVYSLKTTAPALAEHAAIKALLDKCLSQLVARFGDITGLFWDATLNQEFQQLGVLPVLDFFGSDELEVTSENEILTLMGMWMGEERDGRISKEQLGVFWNVLRLGHLTTSFLCKLSTIAPWLPVDLDVLGDAAAWKGYQGANPGKAASMQTMLQSAHGSSSVAWFRDRRKHSHWPGGALRSSVALTFQFSKGSLAKLLTSLQHSGALEDLCTVRTNHPFRFLGYDFFFSLSVQLVSDGSKKTFVVSVCCEFRTSAFISDGSRTLVHFKASCGLGKENVPLGDVDDFLYGTHTWELASEDTLDGFSDLLGSYLDQDGSLSGKLLLFSID